METCEGEGARKMSKPFDSPLALPLPGQYPLDALDQLGKKALWPEAGKGLRAEGCARKRREEREGGMGLHALLARIVASSEFRSLCSSISLHLVVRGEG